VNFDELKSFRLPSSFWKAFVERHWEKAPTVIDRSIVHSNVVSCEDIHDALRNGWNGVAIGKLEHPPHLYVGGHLRQLAADILPEVGESIDQYMGRLARHFGTAELCIRMARLHGALPAMFFRAREFLLELLRLVGYPGGGVDTFAFYGTYLNSPARLHKDDASTFVFVGAGSKTYLTWPFEALAHLAPGIGRYGNHILRHVNYRDYLDLATEIRGYAGDIIYLPASGWHIAIGDGAPSYTANIAMFLPLHAQRQVLGELDRLLAHYGDLGKGAVVPLNAGSYVGCNNYGRVLHEAIENVLQVISAIEQHGALRRALTIRHAAIVSAAGFRGPLSPYSGRDRGVNWNSTLCGSADHIVVPYFEEDGAQLVCANGHAIIVEDRDVCSKMTAALNCGIPFCARDICPANGKCDDYLDLLQRLSKVGAIAVDGQL